MSFAALRSTIRQTVQVLGITPYDAEGDVQVLPAIVVGWPTSITSEFAFRPGTSRDVDVAVAVYLGTQVSLEESMRQLDALIDGPLIDLLTEAMTPHGVVTSIGQIEGVTIGQAKALRVPISISAAI